MLITGKSNEPARRAICSRAGSFMFAGTGIQLFNTVYLLIFSQVRRDAPYGSDVAIQFRIQEKRPWYLLGQH